jgi:hypothetical protein
MNCYDCAEWGEETLATQRWDNREVHYYLPREPAWLDLCDAHFSERDNHEPPEPDGEAFRGGEAAAYQAEQMAAWQRLK